MTKKATQARPDYMKHSIQSAPFVWSVIANLDAFAAALEISPARLVSILMMESSLARVLAFHVVAKESFEDLIEKVNGAKSERLREKYLDEWECKAEFPFIPYLEEVIFWDPNFPITRAADESEEVIAERRQLELFLRPACELIHELGIEELRPFYRRAEL